MKKLLILAALLPLLAQADPFDMRLKQRNASDTGDVDRALSAPAGGASALWFFDGAAVQPAYITIGSGLSVVGGALVATATPGGAVDWASITNKPATFAPSAHTQDWSTITGAPTTLVGFGITDAVTSAQLGAGLAGKLSTPAGTTSQYLRGDGSLATFPSIPAAQVNADWNASSGVAQILNKPTITSVPTINRARITTAADGSFAWTLPTACATGITPIVSITPESATANDAISHRIVSTTNTTVNVFAGRSAALTVLSLTVLGIPTGAAIPLHLIAICP